jgi:tight adherence protein B
MLWESLFPPERVFCTGENWKWQERSLRLKKQKQIQDVMGMVLSVGILLVLFYRSIWFLLILGIPMCLASYRGLQAQWQEEKKWQLNLEFKEGLHGIAAALNAGYSVENAIAESQRDLIVLYGKESLLYREFQIMLEQLRLNQPVEIVFDEFAKRSGVEDIRSFAETFRTARRSGGDLVAITRTSAQRIGEKIEVQREIRTLISGKQMEGKIMNIVPLAMIGYFWVCSPGFLDCFYEGFKGRFMMTCLLAVYLAAYFLSRKISDIKV